MRADVHEGPEHMLQSEAGYIDARPHRQDRRKPLAPHGRTIQTGQNPPATLLPQRRPNTSDCWNQVSSNSLPPRATLASIWKSRPLRSNIAIIERLPSAPSTVS